MAGTSCPDLGSTEYNRAMLGFLFATPEELQDFLFDHAGHNLEHHISWYDAIQEVYRTPQQGRVYREYLRSPEWQRKRQAVLNRAMQSFIVEPMIIHRTRDRYGRLIESISKSLYLRWRGFRTSPPLPMGVPPSGRAKFSQAMVTFNPQQSRSRYSLRLWLLMINGTRF